MFNENDVRGLADFPGEGYLLTSLYLQAPKLANRSHRDELIVLKGLFKEARRQWDPQDLPKETVESLEQDARQMLDYLSAWAESGANRDLALFACSGRSFFKALGLPGGVKTGVTVGETFALRPLVASLDEHPRHCVVMLNREKAQIYQRIMGLSEDPSSIQDGVPARVRAGGFGGYRERQIERHVDQEIHRHYQRVAEALLDLLKRHRFDRLVLAGHKDAFPEFENQLHADLRKRVIGRFVVDPASATGEEVRARALQMVRESDQAEKQRLVSEVLNHAGQQGRGVIGLDATLEALSKRQVMTLLVSHDLFVGGKRCRHCGYLGGVVPSDCPQCSAPLHAVEDIIEYAISHALLEDARVRFITSGADFKDAGGIAALLRYRSEPRP